MNTPVNIVVGRFQPYTRGHQACVDQAFQETGMDTVLCVVETPREKVDDRHPFPTEMLLPWFEKTIKGGNHVVDTVMVKNADIVKIAQALEEKEYILGSWTCGTDRYRIYGKMCQDYWEKVRLPAEPRCIEVKRGGDDVSATKVRHALRDGDKRTYQALMNPGWKGAYSTLRNQILAVAEEYHMRPLAEYITEALGLGEPSKRKMEE